MADDPFSQVELEVQSQYFILSVPSFAFIKQLKLETNNSSELLALHLELVNNAESHPDLKCVNGIFSQVGSC